MYPHNYYYNLFNGNTHHYGMLLDNIKTLYQYTLYHYKSTQITHFYAAEGYSGLDNLLLGLLHIRHFTDEQHKNYCSAVDCST